jgi:hypothetical protein
LKLHPLCFIVNALLVFSLSVLIIAALVHPYHQDCFSFIHINPYAFNNTPQSLRQDHEFNWTYFLHLLDNAKIMNFRGVALAGLEFFVDDGLLEEAIDACEARNLKIQLYFPMWIDRTCLLLYSNGTATGNYYLNTTWALDGFPNNTTQVDAFLDFVENVSRTASSHDIEQYVLFYPFDFAEPDDWKIKTTTSEYMQALQQIVNRVREFDQIHKVFLVSDNVENHFGLWGIFPYNLTSVDGFGFCYYSEAIDQLQEANLTKVYNFYANQSRIYAKGLVNIAEWGFKTHGKWEHGLTSNETMKCKLIRHFIDSIHPWKVSWTYFTLTDWEAEDSADWGLINKDLSLRLSGEAMRQKLAYP